MVRILRPKDEAPIIVLSPSERTKIDKLNQEDPIDFLEETEFPSNVKVAKWILKDEISELD